MTAQTTLRALDAAAMEARRARIRNRINAAGGRFAGVEFIKKDGSLRTMNVQPARLKFEVKGDAASEAAQRATETRKANNPNLMPVWDVAADAIRSINLDTVLAVTVDGVRYEEFA